MIRFMSASNVPGLGGGAMEPAPPVNAGPASNSSSSSKGLGLDVATELGSIRSIVEGLWLLRKYVLREQKVSQCVRGVAM